MSCLACNEKFKSNAVRISCGKCNASYHRKCSNIGDAEWKKFASGDYLFNCVKCKANRRSSIIGTPPAPPLNQNSESNDELLQLKKEISSFKEVIAGLKASNNDVETSLTNLHDTMSSIESSVRRFEERFKILDEVVAENTRLRNQLGCIEKRLVALEGRNHGLPNKKSSKPTAAVAETVFKATIAGVAERTDEDPKTIVSNLLTKIEAPIGDSVISCERLQSKEPNSVLLVTFSDRKSLDSFIKKARELKPTNTIFGGDNHERIYVNEKLPAACYQLLKQAKVLRQHGFRFIWSRNGRVLARKEEGSKVSHIKDANDINSLINTSH